MSSGLPVLAPNEADITKMVMAGVHLGTKNCNFQMNKYVYKRRPDGVHIIDMHKTYEKIVFAARIIAAIENPKDVCVISGPLNGQRAVLKFASMIGATAIAGRYTPGTFTNQIQKAFKEPRLLIVTDPAVDHQPVREASYVNLPTIAICDTDTPMRYVDVAIPANNKAVHSVGLIWWMLAREVLRFRGTLQRKVEWDVMPDLYFYRDPDEVEREEQEAAAEAAAAAAATAAAAAQPATYQPEWSGSAVPEATATQAAAGFGASAPGDEWGAAAPATGDWSGAAPGKGAGWEASA